MIRYWSLIEAQNHKLENIPVKEIDQIRSEIGNNELHKKLHNVEFLKKIGILQYITSKEQNKNETVQNNLYFVIFTFP
jgi:hypothetical protein